MGGWVGAGWRVVGWRVPHLTLLTPVGERSPRPTPTRPYSNHLMSTLLASSHQMKYFILLSKFNLFDKDPVRI